MALLTDHFDNQSATHRLKQAERQQHSRNQPPKKLQANGQSPLMRAIQRPSNFNTAIVGAPGVVRQPSGSFGVGSQLNSVPGLNDRADSRISADKARSFRVASNVATNHASQIAGVQGQRRQFMFGENPPSNFITGRHYNEESGQMKPMSDIAVARQQMNPDQLARNEAFQGRKADRKDTAFAMRMQRRDNRSNAEQVGPQQNILNTPLFMRYAQANPQGAMELAARVQSQQQDSAFRQAAFGQTTTDSLADRELRSREVDSTIAMNSAREQVISQSTDPSSQRLNQLLDLANSPALAGNPQLQEQLGIGLAEAVGLSDNASAMPSSVPRSLTNSEGAFDYEGAESLASYLIHDEGLQGEDLKNRLLERMTTGQLEELAMSSTTGLGEVLGSGLAGLWALPTGGYSDLRHKRRRTDRTVGGLRAAAGLAPAAFTLE